MSSSESARVAVDGIIDGGGAVAVVGAVEVVVERSQFEACTAPTGVGGAMAIELLGQGQRGGSRGDGNGDGSAAAAAAGAGVGLAL